MMRHAPRTGYYLNRSARRLALIGRNVRLPATVSAWVHVADGEQPLRRVIAMLTATFPELDAAHLPFASLLTDSDIDEEQELLTAVLLKGQPPQA